MSEWPQLEWEESKTAFDWDGSWRDLYVFDTSAEDWQRLVGFVKESGQTYTLRRDGEICPLPAHVSVLLRRDREAGFLLSIDVSGLWVNTHFFCAEQIELDIDPREVQSEERARALFEFMRGIGQALGKAVRLTPENLSDYVLFEYDPIGDTLQRVRP